MESVADRLDEREAVVTEVGDVLPPATREQPDQP